MGINTIEGSTNMATPIFYHPDQAVEHDFISTNKIPEFVRQSGRFPVQPPDLAAAALYVAHDRGYVAGVMDGTTPNGFGTTDPALARYALASVASFTGAVEHVLQGRDPVACSASQGFHHAHWSDGFGYCTFNGLMVAAAQQLQKGAVDRVLIIDGDGHYGDGTADIIELLGYEDRVVNVGSETMHGLVDEFNRSQWYEYFRGLIEQHRPGIIMYQAGADAWKKDPYEVGYLSILGLMKRDRALFRAAEEAGIPLAWNLAGGYSEPMQTVIELHMNTLTASDEVYYGGP